VCNCLDPQFRWKCSTRCPMGPLTLTVAGCGTSVDPTGSTPHLGIVDDLASRSKKELSLDSSSLTKVREASTLGFHVERHLLNEDATDSSAATRCSRWCSADSNSEKCMLMVALCIEKPSQISSRTWSHICLTNSSTRSLMLGSMASSFLWRVEWS
jgi:hypothetical protein